MCLREICNHPYILSGAEEYIQNAIPNEPLINSSSKFVFMDKLLPRLRQNGSRVLLFSQFVMLLDVVEEFVRYRNYPFARLDGKVSASKRQEEIARFCNPDQDCFIFLISTKAGGTGLNLTIADTVILLDSDWNPQNDLQVNCFFSPF